MNIAITQREVTIRGWTYDCTQQDWFDFLGQHTLWTIPNNAPFNLTEADCLVVSGGTSSERRNRTESMGRKRLAARRRPQPRRCSRASRAWTRGRPFVLGATIKLGRSGTSCTSTHRQRSVRATYMMPSHSLTART